MKPHPVITLLLAAILLAPSARAEVATEGAEPGKWTMDFDAAKKLAKEKDLPLLLNFTGSDWCGWCKLMDQKVFARKEWQDFAANKLVLVTLDFPNDKSIVPAKFVERNNALRQEFGIRGYPTYVLLDSDAKTELGRLGAGKDKTPASFAAEVDAVLAMRPASIEAKARSLGPVEGQQYRAAVKKVRDAKNALDKWIATNPGRTPANEAKFEQLIKEIEAAEEALKKF